MDLTRLGIKIGSAAHLSIPQLEKLKKEKSSPEHSDKSIQLSSPVEEIHKLASDFKWTEVRRRLKQNKRSATEHLHGVLIPAVLEMNRLVDRGTMSISQEHIFSALIKESLSQLTSKSKKYHGKSRVVMATPEGDYHELGILIAATIADLAGTERLLLGANMPKRDLAESCIKYKATHLILSSAVSRDEGAKEDWLSLVNFLDRTLPSTVALWVAGRNAAKHSVRLQRPFQYLTSFDEFSGALNDI
jgi:methanogenic corrinoid protein MtbC1